MMTTPEVSPHSSRETRLLLVTIAISVGALLLLARFRFPDESASQAVESAPAPLERLAARAAYDELASIMADLDRRIAPRVTVIRTRHADGRTGTSIAPRMLPDRAVAIVPPGDTVIAAARAGEQELIDHDLSMGIAVLRVPSIEGSAVPMRQLPLRSGPRYVGVLEATAIGPALTPLYVGRVESFDDPRSGMPLLSFAGLQRDVAPGAAIFSLEGLFVGLVSDSGGTVTVVPAEILRASAQSARPSVTSSPTSLGVEVEALTAALARATGAEQGVIVVHVAAKGPADGKLRSGDVLQSVDGMPVTSPLQFGKIERSRASGATVEILGRRGRAPLQVSLDLGGPSGTAEAANGSGLVGRSVPGVGIEVIAVSEGSAASRAGLRRGDLITALNGETAPDTADITRHFRAAEPASVLLLTILRNDRHQVLPLEKH